MNLRLALLLLLALPALADTKQERQVDRAALQSQQNAINKLSGLLKKYRKTRQEPGLMFRLAELQSQSASIRFRISHSISKQAERDRETEAYKKSLKTAIATYSDLIHRFPGVDEVPRAYFLRGKSYEDLGDKKSAEKDYLVIVEKYSSLEESTQAYMSLAGFASEANQHERAVKFLIEVEKRPDDPYYPFALRQLAWSHFNLGHIATALDYSEKNVHYYDKRRTKDVTVTSDEALRDSMLLDIPVFFLDGIEKKISRCEIEGALDYFKGLDDGSAFGRMTVRFSKLLRSHGLDSELTLWKTQLLEKERARPETLETVLIVFEHQLNRRCFDCLVRTSKEISALYDDQPKFETFAKARKLLLDTADQMQGWIRKNKEAEGVKDLSRTLASIYESFARIVDDSDPRIPQVHYNLAEILFETKDYAASTLHYRWVVGHGSFKATDVRDASLKAIASRYEELKLQKFVPENIQARKIDDVAEPKLDTALTEWIDWIDTHIGKTGDPIESFSFEANRTLYAKGHLREASKRMRRFAEKYPISKVAVPSASLVLDTEIAGENWEAVQSLSESLLEIKEWKALPFAERLSVVAADAAYKQVEQIARAGESEKALKRVDQFLKKFAKSQRHADALVLGGTTALAIKDNARAEIYFKRLVAEAPASGSTGQALLALAALSEDKYDFTDAASRYKAYLGLPEKLRAKDAPADLTLKKKNLVLAWLSDSATALRAAIADPAYCGKDAPEELKGDCERYEALAEIRDPKLSPEQLYEKAKHASERIRSAWAVAALEKQKDYEYRERLWLIRQTGQHWDKLDGLEKFALLPHVTVSLPEAMSRNRKLLEKIVPLRANEKSILRRVEGIQELEAAASQALKTPWTRVQALILNETAALYMDLSKGLRDLPTPSSLSPTELQAHEDLIRKLVLPFEDKAQDIRLKAFELASRHAVEDDVLHAIADPFFKDNPSQALKLALPKPQVAAVALAPDLLSRWDDGVNWEKSGTVQARWISALKAKHWAQVGFFLQEAKAKSSMPAASLGLARAISLQAVGAQAEALVELASVREALEPEARIEATRALAARYQSAHCKEKYEQYTQELAAIQANKS